MADEHRRGRRGAPTSLRTAAVQVSVQALAADRRQALGRPLRVLDLGGGTGGLAVPLAEQGHHVTVVDPSPDALAILARRADESGVADRVTAVQGDLGTLADGSLADRVPPGSADLVLCHGVLEIVDDVPAALASIAALLRPGGVLSLLVGQRHAAVVTRAMAGHFAQALAILDDAGSDTTGT
ncbi:MAG TPA: methyltransferase, partial [Pedococcus sp.]